MIYIAIYHIKFFYNNKINLFIQINIIIRTYPLNSYRLRVINDYSNL